MILHTIVPEETLYAGIEELKAPEETVAFGVAMEVVRLGDGRARIVRLLSPLPHHYLDGRLSPGNEIRL